MFKREDCQIYFKCLERILVFDKTSRMEERKYKLYLVEGDFPKGSLFPLSAWL